MKIAFQGTKGSYSYLAGIKYFGKNKNFIGTKTFKDVFNLVSKKHSDFGIIPIENTIAGSIYENYDLLIQHKVFVTGEIYLKIEHNLLGIKSAFKNKSQRIKYIKKVLSHPKALEQCNKFFEKYSWIEKSIFSDTAEAAKYVAESNDISLGAIASKKCAQLYNLEIIKTNIEDNKNNYTRFLIISNFFSKNNLANKSSLVFTLPHKPGKLYEALEIFAKNNINLTKLESRPIIGKPFKYMFFIDFEFHQQLKDLIKIIKKFKRNTSQIKILGFYQSKTWNN